MNNTATFARKQPYKGLQDAPDPRTATCAQHQFSAPTTDTGVGYNTEIPESLGWPCVVCPTPNAELIGTEVIVTSYDGVYLWGGPDTKHGRGWTSLSISLRGLPNVVTCDFDKVAPADTVIDVKDPRVTVEKLPKKRDYQDSGPWLPRVDHPSLADWNPRAEKTKRDALAYAARRLAIADFHEKRRESA